MESASPQPAAPAEVAGDPIAALRREFDAKLEAVHLLAIEDVVHWRAEYDAQRDAEAAEREAKRDKEFAELRAELAGLRKAANEPDLDGLTIDRAILKYRRSRETIRRWCANGKIEAAKDRRGNWRITTT
jgi:hypothetical protein